MSDRQPPLGPGGGSGQGPPKRGFLSRNPFLVIALILLGVVALSMMLNDEGRTRIDANTFWDYIEMTPKLDAGKTAPGGEDGVTDEQDATEVDGPGIVEVVLLPPTEARGTLRPAPGALGGERSREWTTDAQGLVPFTVNIVDAAAVEKSLRERGIRFKVEYQTNWASAWIWILPLIFFVFIITMMFRSSRMSGENVLSFGRSRAKIVGEEKTGVTFQDVADAKEAKEELTEIVEFLKEPAKFTELGGKIPKGVLLLGPPGCGKTLLARAVAGEADVPFFSISGSDFVEMFVGVGAARVRDLFNTAKQKAPCIIFVDEIDAVGRHRGTGMGGGHDEREQTLNQLLVEMDGFDGRKSVIVIAATNRPDILDPALLRPGRFDRNVVLDAPDVVGREQILQIHSRNKPLEPGIDLKQIAKRTPGFSGADLANVMNEAALLAARRNLSRISVRELDEAVERVVAGPERRSRVIRPEEKKILAYHELGHALVARFSPHADSVHKVSIIPRGRGALGYTLTLPDEDRYIVTKEEILARIRVTMGGRSAEEVVFGHKSTGAEDDLQKATQLARSLVCRWGMNDEVGAVSYAESPGSPFVGKDMGRSDGHSEETSANIDRQVRKIIETCHEEARTILLANQETLHRLAEILMNQEVLDMDAFECAVQEHAEAELPPRSIPEARAFGQEARSIIAGEDPGSVIPDP